MVSYVQHFIFSNLKKEYQIGRKACCIIPNEHKICLMKFFKSNCFKKKHYRGLLLFFYIRTFRYFNLKEKQEMLCNPREKYITSKCYAFEHFSHNLMDPRFYIQICAEKKKPKGKW